jgi:TolA-binding protein
LQRGSGNSEKGPSGVALFIERNPDNVASTLEWRERVLHSQEATQTTSSRQQHTAEERWLASLKTEIEEIRRHYQKQERFMEEEIVKHEERHKLAIEQLEKEEKDEEGYSVAEWWEVQSDYQPTECGQ